MNDQERCDLSLGTVQHTGDVLPQGFEYRCPNSTYPHWGVTSGAPDQPHFVSINVDKIGPNDAKLRYTIAHELCHARAAVGEEPFYWRDEEATDRCAANYGFPNTYFSRTGPGGDTYGMTVLKVNQNPAVGAPVIIGALLAIMLVAVAIIMFVARRWGKERPAVIIHATGDVKIEDRSSALPEERRT